jgi:hypothetical protein
MCARSPTGNGSTLTGISVAAAITLLLGGAADLQASPLFAVDLHSTPLNSTENTGSAARIGFDILSTSKGPVVDLSLTNITPEAIGSRLTAVGIEWPDIFTALPVFATGGTSSYFDRINYNVDVSPGWMNAAGGYDEMITSDGNFEGGSPQGAPRAGQSQTVRLALGNTGLTLSEIQDEFASFYPSGTHPLAIARFQSVGPGENLSDKVTAPEPTTLAMLGFATLLMRKRR